MLIPSHRHKLADLALWRELEEADRVHGERLLRSGKIERSLETITAFVDAGPCYASCSMGKDSITLAHLIWQVRPIVPLVHLRAVPHANPENSAVRDVFLTRFPMPYQETIVDYRDISGGLSVDQIERAKDRRFYAAFPRVGRYLSGIRADESSGRKKRFKRWGLTSLTACAPLGWWTAEDVYGYLAINDLPTHPSYAMLGGGRWERKHIRVDELGGDRGTGFGRLEWEREYYSDIIRRLEAGRF